MKRNSLCVTVLFCFLLSMVSASELDEVRHALSLRDQKRAVELSEKLIGQGSATNKGMGMLYLAKAHLLLNNNGKIHYDKAAHYAQKALKNTQKGSELFFEAKLQQIEIQMARGHYMKSLESVLMLQAEDWVAKDEKRMFQLETQLFRLYIEIEDLDRAKMIYPRIKALLPGLYAEAKVVNRRALGNYFFQKGQLDAARNYFTEAIRFASGNPGDRVDAWHMLAEIEKELGNYDRALELYNEILAYEDKVRYEHGFILTLLIATETSIMAGKESASIARYAHRAYNFALQLNNQLRLAQTQVALGYFYLQDDVLDSARYFLSDAFRRSSEIEAYYWQRSSARLLSEVYQKAGDFERAYEYKQEEINAGEQLASQSRQTTEQMLKNAHLIHRFHQEKELSRKELKTQQYYLLIWIAVAVGTLLISLLLLRMYVRQKRHNRFLVEKALKEARLKQQHVTVKKQVSEKSGIDDAVLSELRGKLEKFLADKGYLDPNCSLSSLAKSLETNTTYLSHLINDSYEVSFNQFVNEYRVTDFIERMQSSPEMRNTYTLEHLASMSGFKSKSTFIRAFKKQTGITPSVFIQNLSKSQ